MSIGLNPSQVSQRTVRLHGLRGVDVTVIRLLLQFAHHQTGQNWTLTSAPKADLLLLNPDAKDASLQAEQASHVVWVVERGQAAPNDGRPVLKRPLQQDAFYNLLRAQALRCKFPASSKVLAATQSACCLWKTGRPFDGSTANLHNRTTSNRSAAGVLSRLRARFGTQNPVTRTVLHQS